MTEYKINQTINFEPPLPKWQVNYYHKIIDSTHDFVHHLTNKGYEEVSAKTEKEAIEKAEKILREDKNINFEIDSCKKVCIDFDYDEEVYFNQRSLIFAFNEIIGSNVYSEVINQAFKRLVDKIRLMKGVNLRITNDQAKTIAFAVHNSKNTIKLHCNNRVNMNYKKLYV